MEVLNESGIAMRLRERPKMAGLRRGLREQILEEIRAEVISGRMSAGQQLVERHLASHFGVSHAPVREALLQLSQEGLLIAQPHAGVRVRAMTEGAIREMFARMRTMIETFAIEQIAPQMSESDWSVCDEIIARQRTAAQHDDWPMMAILDYRLHRWWIERCDAEEMLPVWHAIMARARLFVAHDRMQRLDAGEFCRQHEAMIDAMRRGMMSRAIELLDSNIMGEVMSH